MNKVKNIGFDGNIGTWILRIYPRYIGGYFYMNIDISKINKNTLKFMKILCKSFKNEINNQIYTLILHCNGI